MAQSPFDAVLFDCDGVLVDSEAITNRILAAMLAERGWAITPEETLRIFLGKAVRDEAALIEERTGQPVTDDWIAAFRQRRNLALESELVEIPGASFAVHALHGALGGRVAVASGADLHKVRMQLAKVGLLDYFEGHVLSGQDLPRSKPHPDVYRAAAASLGVDPRRCAVIEDTVIGARAGVAAGATVFGYSPGHPGHASASALLETGAVHVFRDMHELPALLAGWAIA